ncbi:MAG: GAF domain-containing protein [Candidatus Anammoxibacter sp.]
MNIKRIIKKSNIEERIISFSKIVPVSLCIKDKNNKTILSLSDNKKEPSSNYPIKFNEDIIGELSISEDNHAAEFVLQLINDVLVNESKIARINEETLLLYTEINLLYDLSLMKSRGNMSMKESVKCLLEKSSEFFKAQNASLWIVGEDAVCCESFIGIKPEKDIFKLGEGFIGQVATSDRGEVLNYPINDVRWTGNVNPKTSIMALLLKVRSKNAGVLLVTRRNETPFNSKDFKLCNVFAYQISLEMEAVPPFLWVSS